MPKGREGWSEKQKQLADGQVGGPFYIGTQDGHSHSAHFGDTKCTPWLKDAVTELAHELDAAYFGKIANAVRDCIAVGLQVRQELVENPEVKERIQRLLQLHLDAEEQAWEQVQFDQMGKFATSCEATLRLHSDAGNWMLVSKWLEKMRKRVNDGLLMEPHKTTVEKIIAMYEEKLRNANV